MEAQIEEAIKFRKKANFKILTRLSQIIDQYPYLRFHQILIIYKISELGCKREHIDFGFEVEIEINGELHKFNYDKMVSDREYIAVAIIKVDSIGNITLSPVIAEGATSYKSMNEWGIDTMRFQTVSCIMYSPNYWEGNEIGNKHLFFMIDGCKNPDPVRGFFNEYLRPDLEKDHKRVFEAIGSRAKAEYNDNQLSGLGFSSTSHDEVVVKVDNKPFKIKF